MVDSCWQQQQMMEHVISKGGDNRGQGQRVSSWVADGCGHWRWGRTGGIVGAAVATARETTLQGHAGAG